MALPPSFYADPFGILLLFELPSQFYFVMYTTVLLLWTQVIYQVRRVRATMGNVTILLRVYIIVNVIVGAVFIIVGIIYYSIGEDSILPCQVGSVVQSV